MKRRSFLNGKLCPHCGGGHFRARSQMRCHVRHLRRIRHLRKVRLWKDRPAFVMTGEFMRKFRALAAQREEHVALTINPRLG